MEDIEKIGNMVLLFQGNRGIFIMWKIHIEYPGLYTPGQISRRFSILKKFSKILSVLLCLAMVLGLAAVVGAEGETTSTWTKVELSDITASDTIAITMSKGDSTWALPTSGNGTNGLLLATDVTATVNGDTLTVNAVAGACGWNITSTTDGYYIKAGDSFLYLISDNKGTRVGSTECVWSVQSNYLTAKDTGGTQRYIGVYNSTDWRSYTSIHANISGQTLGFWKLASSTGEPATPTTPEEIVNAAYALEQGKSLSGTYSLTGKIISVDTPYSEEYSNITVTIQVGDMTDKPIQCFRLKGEGASTLAVNDTITVTGTLKNYNGTVQFNAGCTVSDIVKGTADPGTGETPTLTTPEEIVNAAYALEQGKSLSGTYSLTGKIISVDTAYSEQYSNITVTIQVGDMTDKPIQCFRLKGEGAATLAVGDTITVTGTLKNYNGTVEFDSGCTVSDIVKGEANPGEGEENPPKTSYTGTLLSSLKDGDEVVIYSDYLKGLMTYEDSVYNDKHQLKSISAAVADGKVSYNDGAIVLTVHVKDNVYSFTTPSGLYLYVDGTHTMFVSEAGENTQFVLEQAEGGFYVKCATATYNDKPQYLEAYKGVFTTFGMNENNAAQYVFQFYAADPETPRTGDTSLSMLVALMAVSALGIVVVTSKKKEF